MATGPGSIFNDFIQEKLKSGRISHFQSEYLYEQSLTAGVDIKDILREFNLLIDYDTYCIESRIAREKERLEQQREFQLSQANDKIKRLTAENQQLQTQVEELHQANSPLVTEKNNLIGRAKLVNYENPRFNKKIKELEEDIKPVKEKITTLEGLIAENNLALTNQQNIINSL